MDKRPHSRKKFTSNENVKVTDNVRESNTSIPNSNNDNKSNNQKPRSKSKAKGGIGGLILIALIIAAVVFFLSKSNNSNLKPNEHIDNDASLNLKVDTKARDKYTVLKGDGSDKVTIMLYLCGSDLETKYGSATKDIGEILNADFSDNVKVIIQTGGAKKWQNTTVSSDVNQRYLIDKEGSKLLENDLGDLKMSDPKTLSDFIKYSKEKYPADRYILIMWDHGGGSVGGFAYDEHFPKDTMQIDELNKALNNAGVKFDFIGFDACLMANLEQAAVLTKHADYMLASEEVEPLDGWYYTDWINELNKNSSIKTTELGKIIVDSYIEKVENKNFPLTLSLIDLAELEGTLPDAIYSFSKNMNNLMEFNGYEKIVDARINANEMSKGRKLDQIDVIHFANNLGAKESKEFIDTISSSIKYNRTKNIRNANGLSMYFPYQNLNKMGKVSEIYKTIGIDDEYQDAVKSFASIVGSGQIATQNVNSSSISIFDVLLGNSFNGNNNGYNDLTNILYSALKGNFTDTFKEVFGDTSWLNDEYINKASNYIKENHLDANNLALAEKDGKKVLELTEKEWSLIKTIELNAYVDTGYGYIELGLDNVFEFNTDNDLIVDYDRTWLTINDHLVAYYLISDETYGYKSVTTGYIPVLLNGEYVNLIIQFTERNPRGEILGAQKVYDDIDIAAKGLLQLNTDDVIQPLCEYYSYNREYKRLYTLGESFKLPSIVKITNNVLDDKELYYTYRLTDIYNNEYWLPVQKAN